MQKIIISISLLLLFSCSNNNGTSYVGDDFNGAIERENNKNDDNLTEGVAIIDKGVILDEPNQKTSEIQQQRKRIIKQRISNYKEKLVKQIYFNYDDSSISETSLNEITKHVNFIKKNTDLKLKLLGHTDARGSREYNLALGEDRAIAVNKIFKLYNIGDIKVISFGEEKPVDTNNNEKAWAKNRRVEFVYY
ncbi:18K peptidoglycan-associated outer membrane lipoprotein; Peptidoglycan-associated lipoprotein precursor; Outer membrane protein P6; OmpA/MotB precursor [hydrothermal vent metagenome]|uniref:18K peptidoglycan-associated outer membrane lipoprotein Peptidoglycan-associated lipoprotein Outer membrane protein P6 OmpA/MotB n=1 Tax=hydrothermal vent metagenome TaxID=652676 RepID=A0A1W1CCU7_9ZZZZ